MSTYLNNFSRHEEKVFAMGYRVNESGELLNPQGVKLNPTPNSWGYLRFNAGRKIRIGVHRLAAYQRYGEQIYTPGNCVRHLDGNPRNNTPGNLALGTHSDNMLDQPESVRREKALKATAAIKKYDHAVILEYLAHHNYKQARAKFGCAMGTLSFIKRNSMAAKQSATPVKKIPQIGGNENQ